MANGNGNNGRNDPLTRLYVALIVVAGGILTGNGLLVRSATVEIDAPDRYRGTEGRALERRVSALEEYNSSMVDHLRNHPDHALRLSLREALLRIGQLEVENERLRAAMKELSQ